MVYRELQKRIDSLPVAFPETESGVELRLLEHLFDEREAWIACHMSALAEPAGTILRRLRGHGARELPQGVLRSDIPPTEEELGRILGNLAKKGAVAVGQVGTKRKRSLGYSLMPIAVGMFEMQVDRLSVEYATDFGTYMDEGLRTAIFPAAGGHPSTGQMRTVPVGRAIPSEKIVGRYDDIRAYVAGIRGPFAVMNCVCRQSNDLKGASCDHGDIRETCLMLGENAIGMVRRGNARKVDKEEFLQLLDRAEEKGFVVQPRNTQDPTYICCCCGDCCEILRNAKKFPKPAEVMHSNFFAAVDSGSCTGCGICGKRCPMEAVKVVGKKAAVDLDRCIGCGVCVPTCKPGSIRLRAKKTSYVPPRNAAWMFLKMYRERFGLFGAAKVIGKILLKKQV